jgi:hypothetical protein
MVVPHRHQEPPDPDGRPKKKRGQISAAKHAANIANSKCSTGPTTPAGKAASSVNAVTHGMTCKTQIFLPGESPAEYDSEVARWSRQLGAVTEPEVALMQTAVYCRYRQCRARNAQGAAGTRVIEKIGDTYHDRIADEIRALLPQFPIDPGRVVQALRQTSQGCSYLLEQFLLMRARLGTRSSFEVSQRREFLMLSGSRPADLFRVPAVFELDRLYLGAISGPGSFTADEAANALLHDRPAEMSEEEFARRLEPMVQNLPTVADGHAALVALVDQRIAEMTERIELVGLREERDLALDGVTARADTSPEGEKRERYEGMATREQHAALREFRGMVALRHKYGEGDLDSGSDDPEGHEPPSDPPNPPQAAGQEPAQNEATEPEVHRHDKEANSSIDVTHALGGETPSSNSQIPNQSQSAFGGPNPRSRTSEPQPPILDSPEEHEAVRAEYQARLQRVLERVEQEQDQGNSGVESQPPGPSDQRDEVPHAP